MIEVQSLKRSAVVLDLDSLLTPDTSPSKRSRQNSYESPNSVQSMSSWDDDTSSMTSSQPPKPAKRRGRPPKTEPTPLSPSQFQHLSETDYKYMEMRVRNNEASRRSRLNRKDKETQIMMEATKLESNHRNLVKEEEYLTNECAKWRRAVMRLAVM